MFTPLSRDQVKEIVKMQFNLIRKMLAEQRIEIEMTEKATDWLSEAGYDPQYGARPVKRVLQKHLVNTLSKAILANSIDKDKPIRVDLGSSGLEFSNI